MTTQRSGQESVPLTSPERPGPVGSTGSPGSWRSDEVREGDVPQRPEGAHLTPLDRPGVVAAGAQEAHDRTRTPAVGDEGVIRQLHEDELDPLLGEELLGAQQYPPLRPLDVDLQPGHALDPLGG